MLDFTIIIPVYNAEKTLERCLRSIQAQTFSNYEVLLVDDGSNDGSLDICKKFQASDNRYRIICQENGGPSKARNAALEMVCGNWICFVDADDTISDRYLEKIYEEIVNSAADAIYIGYHKVSEKDEICIPCVTADTKEEICVELSAKDMFGYAWIKCFRKEKIGSIRFDTSLDLFEDELFACQVIKNCEKISTIDKALYNYYVSDDSLMGRTHQDYCQKCDKVYSAWKEMLQTEWLKSKVVHKKANSFVERCYYYGFERKVNLELFFTNLKNTVFFEEHTSKKVLDKYVEDGNFKKLYFAKLKYQVKNCIYSFVHR